MRPTHDSAPSFSRRVLRAILGAPRDLRDSSLFHRLSLIPFLAWVGLGADGLSSSAYGPEEAFKALGSYPFLALALALLMATTVLLISAAYRRIIEEFPSGGGGYVVATSLLGPRAGLTSGSALLVDYVLTVTTSIAAAGDAIFSVIPPEWHGLKLGVEIAFLLALTALNSRGVRESVLALLPIFVVFLVTHALLIATGVLRQLPELGGAVRHLGANYHQGIGALGAGGLALLFLRAYSLGGGTYTGIEAVSNGLPIMREPRVQTGKRTMLYMALSLAVTAGGLLLCYLLWHITPVAGKTMNAVLVERLTAGVPMAHSLAVVTLVAEGALLVVAAQAGFIDGPRVLANMAVDDWAPHRFASLSERLTTRNGILLIGVAAIAALLYTRGNVGQLIVMYSINVFLTFSLSMFAMLKFWLAHRKDRKEARRRIPLFAAAFAVCATILVITLVEKFTLGGWVTVVVTAAVIASCMAARTHYRRVSAQVDALFTELDDLPSVREENVVEGKIDRSQPVAAILVSSYGGIGIHTLLNVFRAFPGFHRGVVFLSVGVVDSGEFKGADSVAALQQRTEAMLARYVRLSNALGVPAAWRLDLGTDVVDEAERLCAAVAADYPRVTFFAGKLIFARDTWWQRILHNETPLAIQKRLQWAGRTMVTMPVRLRAVGADP